MKRMGKVLVAVAMVIGAMGATGCKRDQAAQSDSAPVADQPAQDPAANGDDTVAQAAPERLPAPPALRVEVPGPAPSAHHVWQRGFWRWDTATVNYVWAPGYWADTSLAAPFAPPAPRVEYVGYAPGDGYLFVPGYWRWAGGEYAWVYGHWSLRGDAGLYCHSRWAFEGGQWVHHMDRWDGDRWAAWDRDHRGFQHDGHGVDHGAQGHVGGRYGRVAGQRGGAQRTGRQYTAGAQHTGAQHTERPVYHAADAGGAAGGERHASTGKHVMGHPSAGLAHRGHG